MVHGVGSGGSRTHVVCPRPLDIADNLTSSTFPAVTDLVFHFRPDLPSAIPELYDQEGEDILFVRGDFPLEHAAFKFPLT